MSLISLQNVRKFLGKTPEQRRITARFFTTIGLAKLPYAPHRIHLRISPHEQVSFWWSHFPGSTDPEEGSIFAYWGDDVGELRLLWRVLQPGMTFFDVGAYHGIYSVIAAKRLEQAGSVTAFEPSPRELRRLRLHLRLNRLASVNVVPCAAAAEEGEATLATVISGNLMRNSLRPPLTSDPLEPVIVETTTIDKYLALTRTNTVDLVKIDTEGAEIAVFRGADRLLRHLRPMIICEVLDQSTHPWGYPARDIVTRLRAYDYEWFDILRDGSLLPHCLRDEYPEVKNYLAVPREKQDRINLLTPIRRES